MTRHHVAISQQNLREVEARLREKGQEFFKAAKVALEECVDEIVADAKSRSPVDTGKLRDSIRKEKEQNGMAFKIHVDAQNSKGEAYGQYVEFSPRGHPFLYPAIDAHTGEVGGRIRQLLQERH